MTVAAKERSNTLEYRLATERDIPAIVKMGRVFFAESEFTQFAEYDPKRFAETLENGLALDHFIIIVAHDEGVLAGFIAFSVTRYYTKKPVANLFLLYALPEYRRSAIGRSLMSAACEVAKGEEATVFYAGAMAGIPHQDRAMVNMLKRLNFKPLAGWLRRVL